MRSRATLPHALAVVHRLCSVMPILSIVFALAAQPETNCCTISRLRSFIEYPPKNGPRCFRRCSVVRCRRISMSTQDRRFPVLDKVCELGRPAYQVLLELKFQGQLDRAGAADLVQRAEAAIRTAGAEAAR